MIGFHPDTQIEMADGRTKLICNINVGEMIRGGRVLATTRGCEQGFYWYFGVLVAGKHMVKEDSEWVEIDVSQKAMPFKYLTEVICNVETETHRIWAHGIEFLSANADITECQ